MAIDLEITGGPSVYLLRPLTPAARAWIDKHVAADTLKFGDAVAVEWRHVRAIVGGAIADDLVVG